MPRDSNPAVPPRALTVYRQNCGCSPHAPPLDPPGPCFQLLVGYCQAGSSPSAEHQWTVPRLLSPINLPLPLIFDCLEG